VIDDDFDESDVVLVTTVVKMAIMMTNGDDYVESEAYMIY
jgi:hypothetical protein